MAYQPEVVLVDGKELNYYEFLELEAHQPGSTIKPLSLVEIRKAYRSKALIYHPDKNPGDQVAAHLFLQLKRVYDVLVDPQKRSDYDRYLQSTAAKRQRVKEMDGARKKARDDLLERERAARDLKEQEQRNAAKYETELDRLRRFSSRASNVPPPPSHRPDPETSQPRRPQTPDDPLSKIKSRLNELESQLTPSDTTLKVRWRRKLGDYDIDSLSRIFSDFGVIEHIIPSSKKPGTALISFNSVVGPHAVMKASAKGLEKLGPFEISWANPLRQQPPLVEEILSLMKELTSFNPPPKSGSNYSTRGLDSHEAAAKLTLAQFEAWTLARAQAFDQARTFSV